MNGGIQKHEKPTDCLRALQGEALSGSIAVLHVDRHAYREQNQGMKRLTSCPMAHAG